MTVDKDCWEARASGGGAWLLPTVGHPRIPAFHVAPTGPSHGAPFLWSLGSPEPSPLPPPSRTFSDSPHPQCFTSFSGDLSPCRAPWRPRLHLAWPPPPHRVAWVFSPDGRRVHLAGSTFHFGKQEVGASQVLRAEIGRCPRLTVLAPLQGVLKAEVPGWRPAPPSPAG